MHGSGLLDRRGTEPRQRAEDRPLDLGDFRVLHCVHQPQQVFDFIGFVKEVDEIQSLELTNRPFASNCE